MKPRPSVLIIQTAFIGDVVLATALIESIQAQEPDATIDFLVRKGNEVLLEGHPKLRTVYVLDKQRKYQSLMELARTFRKIRYDCVINVQRFATTGLLTVMSGASITIGFEKNPFSRFFSRRIAHTIGEVHEVTRNLSLLAPLGIQSSSRPRLYPTPAHYERVKPYQSGKYITVSPASVWFTKQLPAAQWSEFLSSVSGCRVLLLGGPDDKSLCDEVVAKTSHGEVINLAGQLSLLESAALMAGAAMNYVNDSAPLHLASAMNAPVTAVFCSTLPDFGFGPLSDDSTVVQTEQRLECRPCGLHGHRNCPEGHFRCATTIRKEQLLATLR
ncbi:MAG: glycosyltransferase family 9 protein [Cyclobacteriaceae bacterium]|nr:glycosyltransferase family 9 protein [Cyclobacteriaceae bacterium]